jgi:hypothetical protein
MDQSVTSYVLCIDNGGYPESLEARKIYAVLPDQKAASHEYIRVIDETGEDYLYPLKYFVPLNLSPEVTSRLDTSSIAESSRR